MLMARGHLARDWYDDAPTAQIKERHTLEIVRPKIAFDLLVHDFNYAWWKPVVERSQYRRKSSARGHCLNQHGQRKCSHTKRETVALHSTPLQGDLCVGLAVEDESG